MDTVITSEDIEVILMFHRVVLEHDNCDDLQVMLQTRECLKIWMVLICRWTVLKQIELALGIGATFSHGYMCLKEVWAAGMTLLVLLLLLLSSLFFTLVLYSQGG